MLGRFNRGFDEGSQKGLIAAAYIATNELKRRLRGGYTSGQFVTGNAINSITRSEPVRTANGWKIVVGTNVLYMLYWELGHFNLFMRRFARVEHWRLTMIDTRAQQQEAFTRVFRQYAGAPGSR
jgi:hypothetical protein